MDLFEAFAQAEQVPPPGLFKLGSKSRQTWRMPLATPDLPRREWGLAAEYGWRPLGAQITLRLGPATAGSQLLWVEIQRVKPGPGEPPLAPLSVQPRWKNAGDSLGPLLEPRQLIAGRNRLWLPLPQPLPATSSLELHFDPPIDQPAQGLPLVLVTGLAYLPTADHPPRLARATLSVHLPTQEVRIHRSGRFVIGLKLPREADPKYAELHLQLALGDQPPAAGSVRWTLSGLDGEPLGFSFDERRRRRFSELRGDFSTDFPHHLILLLDVDLAAEAGPLVIRQPRLLTAARQNRSELADRDIADRDLANSEPASHPDIILIVLDAARGDRVGGTYPKRVAPRLEALAEEGLLFSHAYSECPSTLCSIPNLITGLPLLAEGAGGKAGRLADSHQTLAETLHQLGYRTIGLSANPYNSVSRNMHQGFDHFAALWGKKSTDHGPNGMVRQARAAIEATAAEQPLFLQLHFLPPHEPYAPPPRFDLFRDPAYRGPIEAGGSLFAYRTGRASFSSADLEQLVALYDGNFLTADDAAGRVFDLVREYRQWDNTAVVVTADHGEAFLEHGQQGHNADLFEEMLHIPLVIKPPARVSSESSWLDQPVSLGDVVPTLLGMLGRSAPAQATGVDLLTVPAHPRLLIFRTSRPLTPAWALRNGPFKAIACPGRDERWLFNLDQDPAEHTNLAATRGELWSVMTGWLRQQRAALASQGAAESTLFDDEERRVLRALGYAE